MMRTANIMNQDGEFEEPQNKQEHNQRGERATDGRLGDAREDLLLFYST